MSTARVHTAPSKRAKLKATPAPTASNVGAHTATIATSLTARQDANAKKATADSAVKRTSVYRPLLASPFTVSWPTLSSSDAEPLLHTLLEILTADNVQVRAPQADEKQKRKHVKVRPAWLQVGMNEVNARLEQLVAGGVDAMHSAPEARPEPAPTGVAAPSQAETSTSRCRVRFLFVCRADVDPPRLIAHLPLLACTVNSICRDQARPNDGLVLLPLAAMAEDMLAKALKVRRCAAVAISEDAPVSVLNRLSQLLGELRSRSAPQQEASASSSHVGSSAQATQSALWPLRAPWLDAAVDAARASIQSGPSTSRKTEAPSSSTSVAPQARSLPVLFGIPYQPTTIRAVEIQVPADMNAARLRRKETRKARKAVTQANKTASRTVTPSKTSVTTEVTSQAGKPKASKRSVKGREREAGKGANGSPKDKSQVLRTAQEADTKQALSSDNDASQTLRRRLRRLRAKFGPDFDLKRCQAAVESKPANSSHRDQGARATIPQKASVPGDAVAEGQNQAPQSPAAAKGQKRRRSVVEDADGSTSSALGAAQTSAPIKKPRQASAKASTKETTSNAAGGPTAPPAVAQHVKQV